MTTTQLTPAQHAILAYALEHTGGKINWFPDNIKGGARKKVLDGLFNRAMITTDGTNWFIAAEGYDAMGRARPHLEAAPQPTTMPLDADPEIAAAVTAAENEWAQDKFPVTAKPRTRENSKQAEVIKMLQRPEGATIGQICTATGWQAHTVRGTFAGAFKKKLGMNIVSDKPQGGERIYRIA
ncbi:MAG: DUF3489 domain-containing protein [Gammaproteobacteria bacterium]|nr:MAG: DUF3489 domain-containing protein [Gammaproteobacteria bacterium]